MDYGVDSILQRVGHYIRRNSFVQRFARKCKSGLKTRMGVDLHSIMGESTSLLFELERTPYVLPSPIILLP